MKLLKTMFECLLCKDKTQTKFRKPSLLTPNWVNVACSGCASKFRVQFVKVGGIHHRYQMNAVLIEVSNEVANAMQIEDEKPSQATDDFTDKFLRENSELMDDLRGKP